MNHYLVVAVSLVVFMLIPGYSMFHHAWKADSIGFKEVLGNLLIFPFEFSQKGPNMASENFRIVPTAWSVAVELVCYFLMWLAVSRGWRAAVACMLIAGVYHFAVRDMSWGYRYYPFIAAMLPFSAGAVAYFVYKRASALPESNLKFLLLISLAMWVTCLGFSQMGFTWYMNIAALFLFMVSAISLEPRYPRVRRIGKFFGDLAYPVFLCHWIVAFVMYQLVARQYALYVTIIVVLIFSTGLIKISEWIIEPYRDRVRSRVMRATA